MDYIDYRERLGIGFNDEEKKQIFITRVFLYLSNKKFDFPINEEVTFCYQLGIDIWKVEKYQREKPWGKDLLIYYLKKSNENFYDFLVTLVAFLNLNLVQDNKNVICISDIEQIFSDCHILYELLNDDGKYFIFPKGAKELDDALVSEPLEWLNDYPKSRKMFIDALKLYSNTTESNASNAADNFRKALETFFQDFFYSEKSLENFKSEYGEYLEKQGIPKEISNNFVIILDHYVKFNNNYAKHHDKTSANVLEYIMYETGNIIRLLEKLKKEEN